MSQENVEVVRKAWEAYRRRDNEAALALYDPEIEVDLRPEATVDASTTGLKVSKRSFGTG
jgi:ketosteroid isomerase-like protein